MADMKSAPGDRPGRGCDEVGQEALGTAIDSAGDEDGLVRSVEGAVLGRVVLGLDVLAGVLQAATAPPMEAARARASRMRLAMGIDPPIVQGVAGPG